MEHRISELEHARATLRDLHARAAATDPAGCGHDRVCGILDAPLPQPAFPRPPFVP